MNHSIADWNFEPDLPISNHRKLLGQDNELVELLWENGQVVLHSQTQRKHVANPCESRQVQKNDQQALRGGTTSSLSCGNSSNLIHDDETVSWIQYPIEDSFEKEFCSNFFSQLPLSDPMEADNNKPNRQLDQHEQQQFVKSTAAASPAVLNITANSQQQLHVSSSAPEFRGNLMPPPKFQFDSAQQNKNSEGLSKVLNFSPVTEHTGGKSSGGGNLIQREVKECSGMTVGSSYCGSNQVRNDIDFSRGSSNGFVTTTTGLSAGTTKDDARKEIVQNEKGKTETIEPTITSSSSGGSGSCFDRTCKQSTGAISSHKRKSRDGEDYECQSEAAELQPAAANKPTQRSGSSRQSRAAEVHNQSERKRRDRINEKMRALKELIPHCNKTDKASMLDEAIEYLKSLQLQLQVMWMGSGMAPIMFPGIQHYMPRMGMGMAPPALPSIHNPLHLSRVPVVDQSMSMAASQNQAATCQTQQLNPVNYQHHVQNPTFSDQYARFLGFHHMQTASQPMNMFGYGSQTTGQSPMVLAPGSSIRPLTGGAATTSNTSPSGKMG